MRTVANRRRFSFRIIHLLIAFAAVAIALGAWNWLMRWPRVTISGADIRQDASASAIRNESYPYHVPYHVYYLEVRIVGDIDGRARITDPWGSETLVGPGRFDWAVHNEYYDETATLKYEPESVTTGYVTMQYNFD